LPGERATAVAIYRLLQKSAFGPEDIKRLAKAYESALRALELSDRYDPITEIIARRIIEVKDQEVTILMNDLAADYDMFRMKEKPRKIRAGLLDGDVSGARVRGLPV
jgi:hypothetical protein